MRILALWFILLLLPGLSWADETSTRPDNQKTNRNILPIGDVFRPLLADPKEPRFFVSFHKTKSPVSDFNSASVGVGQTFGLVRWGKNNGEDGWQLGWFAGLFSQFNLDGASNDLLNTDFTIGIPLTYRSGPWSARYRIFHQSSHLGDELLLGNQAPVRENLSFEKIDAVFSYEWKQWRLYAGAGYLINRDPDTLKRKTVQTGVEYYAARRITRSGRLLGGIDIQWTEQRDWAPGVSFKFGIQLGGNETNGRNFQFFLEAYDGFNPYGQFYRDDIQSYGLGMAFNF